MNFEEAMRRAKLCAQGQFEHMEAGAAQPEGVSETALNNLNYNKPQEFNTPDDPGSSPSGNINLNNLNNQKKRGGVPRLELYRDEILKKAMSWGVEEWLVQICIRDYGIHTIKATINRIHQIPPGYFKSQYGDLNTQRGRIFNKEMQKLKNRKVG